MDESVLILALLLFLGSEATGITLLEPETGRAEATLNLGGSGQEVSRFDPRLLSTVAQTEIVHRAMEDAPISGVDSVMSQLAAQERLPADLRDQARRGSLGNAFGGTTDVVAFPGTSLTERYVLRTTSLPGSACPDFLARVRRLPGLSQIQINATRVTAPFDARQMEGVCRSIGNTIALVFDR